MHLHAIASAKGALGEWQVINDHLPGEAAVASLCEHEFMSGIHRG